MKRTIAIMALLMALAPCTAYADTAVDVGTISVAVGGVAQGQTVTYEPSVGAADFQERGVVYDDSGQRFTYYSEKVLPGEGLDELNSNGRHVDANGYVVDGDGFIAVASPYGQHEIGTVVESPFGLCRVYDVCPEGNFDVYTSWE